MKNPFQGKHGPLLIAEIGGNHEGNFEYAKHLTQLAIETDVDYVKFQIYSGDTLVSPVESPDRNSHFKKFELTRDQHRELATMVTRAGLKYTASVWDLSYLTWIDEFMPLYKIGSGDLTAYSLLRNIARLGKPMILSTGLSTEEDVLDSIRCIQEANPIYQDPTMLAVLQCTSMYPIQSHEANLAVMDTLRKKTGLTIGYSDHTEGSKALAYAVAMGAEILEFHFTDSREGKQFRDHKVSLTPPEIQALIQEIGLIRKLQGSAVKQPLETEIKNGHVISFRRAVYLTRDVKRGERITSDLLTTLRPNHGIDARDQERLLGMVATCDIRKYERLDWTYFTKE
jgi:N,N'-diacetyllegionaminate synthase